MTERSMTTDAPEEISIEQHQAMLDAEANGEGAFVMPEKFVGKTPEEIAQSYVELERHKGTAKEVPAGSDSVENDPKPAVPLEISKEVADQTGLSEETLTPFYEEFAASGELGEESYEKLASEHGIPKAMVDTYIAGRQAMIANENSRVAEMVGGDESLTSMMSWAGENYSEAEAEAFNAAMGSSNQATVDQAVMGLYARFNESSDATPNLLSGAGSHAADKFESTAQLQAAMSDGRYDSDPAYRSKVDAKLARSDYAKLH